MLEGMHMVTLRKHRPTTVEQHVKMAEGSAGFLYKPISYRWLFFVEKQTL